MGKGMGEVTDKQFGHENQSSVPASATPQSQSNGSQWKAERNTLQKAEFFRLNGFGYFSVISHS